MRRSSLIIAALGALAASVAWAQESTNRVAAVTDWSVFVETDPETVCWGVSSPKESVNTDAEGRPKAVKRSDILLFITFKKGGPATPEVSFVGGYPFAGGSKVTMDIAGTVFELFTDDNDPEAAWAGDSQEDAKIIAAMKSGASAVLKGNSSRGTRTADTFSLLGFTAAMEEAQKRCE